MSGGTAMEKLSIISVEEPTIELWEDICNSCSYATSYHTIEWLEIQREFWLNAKRPRALLINFNDGVSVLVPILEDKPTVGISAHRFWEIWGWVSKETLTLQHHAYVLDYLIRHKDNIILRQNIFDPTWHDFNIPYNEEDCTHALDLRGGVEKVRAKWSRGCKSSVSKSMRSDFEFAEATTFAEFAEFYLVYLESVQRWDKSFVGYISQPTIFRLYHRLSQRTKRVKLWVVKKDGKIVSGALCLVNNKIIHYYNGATLKAYFDLRPANFLFANLIEKACREGYDWLDFGTSAGLEGVIAFKESFGCEKLAFNTCIRRSGLRRGIDTTKNLVNRVSSLLSPGREGTNHLTPHGDNHDSKVK
jgi:Acetyltransferase (GNAT) domain